VAFKTSIKRHTDMDIRTLFATNLRRLRYDSGLSQEALAQEAAINRSYFSKIETGQTYVGTEIIERLGRVLKAQPADFFAPIQKNKR
jgi:transcriptional regulator with XRE-family HTH domain